MADPAMGALLMQFAVAYGCMLVIPGPNTLVVVRASAGTSAARALTAAAGVACGATLASLVAASSAAALPTGAGFRAVSAIVVAALLLRTALNALRPRPLTAPPERGSAADLSVAPFLLGLGVSGLNPVSVPYFASFFISHGCSQLATALTCALVFAMAGAWFSAVGLASTRLGRMSVSRSCRRTFDLVTAAILAGLAFRHLWMAFA